MKIAYFKFTTLASIPNCKIRKIEGEKTRLVFLVGSVGNGFIGCGWWWHVCCFSCLLNSKNFMASHQKKGSVENDSINLLYLWLVLSFSSLWWWPRAIWSKLIVAPLECTTTPRPPKKRIPFVFSKWENFRFLRPQRRKTGSGSFFKSVK